MFEQIPKTLLEFRAQLVADTRLTFPILRLLRVLQILLDRNHPAWAAVRALPDVPDPMPILELEPGQNTVTVSVTINDPGGALNGVDVSLVPEGDQTFVRNLVTTTMIRRALAHDPVMRDLKINPDKVIGQALRALDGWETLGNVCRLGTAARWCVRTGQDDQQEFVPVEAIQGHGEDPDVDDRLS